MSIIGWLLPAALVVFAFLDLLREFFAGPLAGIAGDNATLNRFLATPPAGASILWNFVALLILSYLLLHMLTGAVLASRAVFARSTIARQSLDQTITDTIARWLKTYRSEVETDLASFREPLQVLQSAADGSIIRPSREIDAAHPGVPATSSADGPAEQPPAGLAAAAPPQGSPSPRPSESDRSDQPQASPAELLRRSMQPPGE